VSPWLTARLAAWRELRARWPLLLLGPGFWALGQTIPVRSRPGWDLFLLALLLPGLSLLLAGRGSAASDRWWRGLGGPAWARLLGQLGAQLPPLVFTAGMAWMRLATDGGGLNVGRGVLGSAVPNHVLILALPALYFVGLAARGLRAGFPLLAGPMLAALMLAASMLANDWLRLLPTWLGLSMRLGLLALFGLFFALRWEARLGPWGAAVRRSGRWSWALAALAFLLISTAVEGALRSPHLHSVRDVEISRDGSAVLRLTRQRDPLFARGGRAWLWRIGGERLLPQKGVNKAELGPQGAVLLAVARPTLSGTMHDFVLLDAQGREARCEGFTHTDPAQLGRTPFLAQWSPTGTVAAFLPREWLSFGEGTRRFFLLDADKGCQPQDPEVRDILWLDDAMLVQRDEGYTLDGRALNGLPEGAILHALDGSRLATLKLQDSESDEAQGKRVAIYRIYELRGSQASLLVSFNSREGTYTEDGYCLRSPTLRDSYRCQTWDGQTLDVSKGRREWIRSLSPLLIEDLDSDHVTGPQDRRWQLPRFTVTRFAPLDPDTLRSVTAQAVIDLHADGSRTVRPLRGWSLPWER